MDPTKIRLSSNEMELVMNAEWILTKNGILRKAWHLLEGLQEFQQSFLQEFASSLPAEVIRVPAKISKGENYRGLPYLILDYPRFFEKENVFAIRCMFWWGHHFSITLHLSGAMKERYNPVLGEAYAYLRNEGFYISCTDDEWEHHFEPDNYIPIQEMQQEVYLQQLQQRRFIKLSQRVTLERWSDVHAILSGYFSGLIKRLH